MENLVPVRKITKDEYTEGEEFQNFLKVILKYFKEQDSRIGSFRDYQNFKKEIKAYSDKPWIDVFKNWFKRFNKEILQNFQNKRNARKSSIKELKDVNQRMESALTSLDEKSFVSLAQTLDKTSEAIIKSDENPFKYARNPIQIQDPLFFQTDDLLRSFSHKDMENLSEKNLKEYRYTYLNYPKRSEKDYQFMVYWLQNLKNKPKPVELSKDQFVKYSKFLYDHDGFDDLLKNVEIYLSDNKKSLIPEILKGIKKFPAIYNENERLKHKYTTVYRGIPLGDPDSESDAQNERDIIAIDKKQKYVATSPNFNTALRFAAMIGHLESWSSARSESGFVLEYHVEPNDILLDTNVFGGKFFEEEILINSQTAKLEEIHNLEDHLPRFSDEYADWDEE